MPQYDYNIYSVGSKPDLGVPDFKRYSERKENSYCKPYVIPEAYDFEKIAKG